MSTEDEVLALKEATREAHEAIKDLRQVIKEARQVDAHLAEKAYAALETGVAEIVAAGLDEYKVTISKAIDTSTEAVFRRFDTIADLLMGEDKTTRRRGEPSLVELAEKIKEAGR